VNRVSLEAYVAGTLLGEVPESWGDAALAAQAVAIRTYALHRRERAGDRAWDVEADTRGQVYLGMDGESEVAWRAVRETGGKVLTWDGEVILAAFHGTAGGRTASAAEVWGRPVPYLESVAVEGEDVSPDTYWRAPVSAEELEAALAQIGADVGRVEGIEIAERTPSGRCAALRVRGYKGRTEEVTATALRKALGERRLRSTLFDVRATPDGIVFVGSGHGHGVGMSQWGARAMAERGAGYRAILGRFYPGAQLVSVRGTGPARADAGGSW
jgi:stage II sporulation protein D